jgi:hypothetical protein
MTSSNLAAGFTYEILLVDKTGRTVERDIVKNLVPTEGITYWIGSALKGATAYSSWFVGIFEGNYTPTASDVMATFAAASTESVAYSGSTRKALTLGAIAAGSTDNLASPAEFATTATKTIYGAFISSSSARGGTSGVLLSAARFTSPKVVDPSEFTLRVKASFSLVSL